MTATQTRLTRKLQSIEGEIIAHQARTQTPYFCQWCRDSIMTVSSHPCDFVIEKVREIRELQRRIAR